MLWLPSQKRRDEDNSDRRDKFKLLFSRHLYKCFEKPIFLSLIKISCSLIVHVFT
jgi:hypothetical protein